MTDAYRIGFIRIQRTQPEQKLSLKGIRMQLSPTEKQSLIEELTELTQNSDLISVIPAPDLEKARSLISKSQPSSSLLSCTCKISSLPIQTSLEKCKNSISAADRKTHIFAAQKQILYQNSFETPGRNALSILSQNDIRFQSKFYNKAKKGQKRTKVKTDSSEKHLDKKSSKKYWDNKSSYSKQLKSTLSNTQKISVERFLVDEHPKVRKKSQSIKSVVSTTNTPKDKKRNIFHKITNLDSDPIKHFQKVNKKSACSISSVSSLKQLSQASRNSVISNCRNKQVKAQKAQRRHTESVKSDFQNKIQPAGTNSRRSLFDPFKTVNLADLSPSSLKLRQVSQKRSENRINQNEAYLKDTLKEVWHKSDSVFVEKQWLTQRVEILKRKSAEEKAFLKCVLNKVQKIREQTAWLNSQKSRVSSERTKLTVKITKRRQKSQSYSSAYAEFHSRAESITRECRDEEELIGRYEEAVKKLQLQLKRQICHKKLLEKEHHTLRQILKANSASLDRKRHSTHTLQEDVKRALKKWEQK